MGCHECHSFVHSFNRGLLSTWYVPVIIPSLGAPWWANPDPPPGASILVEGETILNQIATQINVSSQPWEMPWWAGVALRLEKIKMGKLISSRRETRKGLLGGVAGKVLENLGYSGKGRALKAQEALSSKPSKLAALSPCILISSSLKMGPISGMVHAVVGFRTTCLKVPSTRQILHFISKNNFGGRDVLFCTWIFRSGERVKTALRLLLSNVWVHFQPRKVPGFP